MRKKIGLLLSISLMLIGLTLVGCDNKEKATISEVQSEEEIDETLVEEIGKAKTPVVSQIAETDLSEEEAEYVKLIRNGVGVNLYGENLYVVIPDKEKNKLRYVTEVQEDDVVKVYLRKTSLDAEGSEILLLRLNGEPDKEYHLWFYDAETKNPIQLEDLDKAIEQEVEENAEATNVETTDPNAQGTPVFPSKNESTEENNPDKTEEADSSK